LAGFLLANLGHIPTVGESFEFEGRLYRVAEMAGHRINRVVVEDVAPHEEPVDETESTESTQ
jgi:putative hemolysin